MLDAGLGNANGVFDREDYDAALAAGIRLLPWAVFRSLDANANSAVDPGEYQAAVLADDALGKAIVDAVRNSALGVTRCHIRFGRCALIAIVSRGPDSALDMFKVELPLNRVASDARIDLVHSRKRHHPGGIYVGRNGRYGFIQGQLEFFEAHAEFGAPITGRLRGIVFGEGGTWAPVAPSPPGLVINEVAAKGEPLDWFELYNAAAEPIALADFAFADDLADYGQRVRFPDDAILAPGAYLQIQLDKDGWPGFALGSDEELGIWTANGVLVARVDWAEGQSAAGLSFARIPDGTGAFQTVEQPTPGAPNPVPAAEE